MFVDYRTDLVEGSSKRAGEELEQESTKKHKVDEDKDTVELQSLMKITPDEEEITIDAVPLAVMSPSIIGWKIHKEGKKSYYQIIRADGKSQMYLVFSHMIKSLDREDLETLYKLGRIVGIKSLLNAAGITAAFIDVNAAQSKLMLLENFNEIYSMHQPNSFTVPILSLHRCTQIFKDNESADMLYLLDGYGVLNVRLVGGLTLQTLFPRLHKLDVNPNCYVSERCPAWRRELRTSPEVEEFLNLTSLVSQLHLPNMDDEWECIIDDSRGFMVKGHISNGMSDPLFDIYQNVESAKELWDSLESKYMAEDASSKKFLVRNFNNYKMVNSKPVMEQFNKLLRIIGQYTQHGLKIDESIYVSSVIDNSHLRIEESLKAQESDKGKGKEVAGPSVNMIEEGGKNKNNKRNKGKKHGFKDNNGGSGSNKKPKLDCWKCGKTGHFKRDCRSGNNKNNTRASGSGKGSKDQSQDQGQNLVHVWNRFVKYSVSLTSEAFHVQVDAIVWWIVSGAITHVCKDRCWFKTYELIEDGSCNTPK
ncbi:zinc finger, CCHC-type containing protein [Tanacetum coccineum]